MLNARGMCSFTRRVCAAALILGCVGTAAQAGLLLGPGEVIHIGSNPITTPQYSVPSFEDWNGDGYKDLLIGKGGNYQTHALRIYTNNGLSQTDPGFLASFDVHKTDGNLLTYFGPQCQCTSMGLFPRLVDWNEDGLRDLVIGQSEGDVLIYTNVGTPLAPAFGDGVPLEVGPAGSKVKIDVGDCASPDVVDWNNDGKKDLVIGANDEYGPDNGKVLLFINTGTNAAPDFETTQYVLDTSNNHVVVPGSGGAGWQASPVIMDLDDDGKKDLLTGTNDGHILLYSNVGTDADPRFDGYVEVESDGAPLQIVVDIHTGATARTRPFVTDWNNDGLLDLLIGAGDQNVHLYLGVPEPGAIALVALGACLPLLRRRR